MAIMRPGPLGTISGKLGSLVFACKRGSVIVSQPKPHTHRNSTIAIAARNTAAFYLRTWESAAMDPYRDAWRTWAENNPTRDRFGTVRYRTARQAYLHFTPQLKVLQQAVIGPPTNESPIEFDSVTIAFNTVIGLEITLGDPIAIPDLILVLYVSRWAGPKISSKRPSWLQPATPPQLFGVYSYGAPMAALGHEPVAGEQWRLHLVGSNLTGKPSWTADILTPACIVP